MVSAVSVLAVSMFRGGDGILNKSGSIHVSSEFVAESMNPPSPLKTIATEPAVGIFFLVFANEGFSGLVTSRAFILDVVLIVLSSSLLLPMTTSELNSKD